MKSVLRKTACCHLLRGPESHRESAISIGILAKHLPTYLGVAIRAAGRSVTHDSSDRFPTARSRITTSKPQRLLLAPLRSRRRPRPRRSRRFPPRRVSSSSSWSALVKKPVPWKSLVCKRYFFRCREKKSTLSRPPPHFVRFAIFSLYKNFSLSSCSFVFARRRFELKNAAAFLTVLNEARLQLRF